MNMNRGIIYNDKFISETDFKKQFKESYLQNFETMLFAVQNLLDTVEKMLGLLYNNNDNRIALEKLQKKFESQYINFQSILLNNQQVDLTIIVGYLDDNGTLKTTSELISQKNQQVINRNKYTNKLFYSISSLCTKKLKLERAQEFMNNHYNELLNTVSTESPTISEQQILWRNLWVPNRGKNKKETYKDWIYGNRQKFFGSVFESYMAHTVVHEPSIYQILSGNDQAKIPTKSSSVKDEEGENFIFLLHNGAVNNTPWFAGGDIVIINQNGNVLFNIQIKSTKVDSNFNINLKNLKNFLKAYTEQKSLEKLADLVYENFKNSAIIGEGIRTTADNLVRQSLKPKT